VRRARSPGSWRPRRRSPGRRPGTARLELVELRFLLRSEDLTHFAFDLFVDLAHPGERILEDGIEFGSSPVDDFTDSSPLVFGEVEGLEGHAR
jgi:hypothetical protein